MTSAKLISERFEEYKQLMESGWFYKVVDFDRSTTNYHLMDEVDQWLNDNCAGKWFRFGHAVLFAESEDAIWFGLKWE